MLYAALTMLKHLDANDIWKLKQTYWLSMKKKNCSQQFPFLVKHLYASFRNFILISTFVKWSSIRFTRLWLSTKEMLAYKLSMSLLDSVTTGKAWKYFLFLLFLMYTASFFLLNMHSVVLWRRGRKDGEHNEKNQR